MNEAADCLLALAGQPLAVDDVELNQERAEVGALLVAEFLHLIRSYLTAK